MTSRSLLLTIVVGGLLAGACQKGEYAEDADTGAAAPATKLDPSATPNAGDSTLGVTTDRAKGPAISGDTTGRSGEKQSVPPPRP